MKNIKILLLLALPLLLVVGLMLKGRHAPAEQTVANMEEIFEKKGKFDPAKLNSSPEYFKELSRILREGRKAQSRSRAAAMMVYISTPSPAKPLFDSMNFDKSPVVRMESLKSLQTITGLNRRARTVVDIEAINSHSQEMMARSLKSIYAQTRGSQDERHLYEIIVEAFPDVKDMKLLKSSATVLDLNLAINQTKDKEVRLAALDVINYSKAAPMIRITLPLTKNKSDAIRRQAARTLGLMRHYDSVAPLTAMMDTDKSQDVRLMAAQSLAKLHAYAPLQAALTSKDAMARLAAVTALGAARKPIYFPLIKDTLKDQNSEVRKAAAYALGRYRTTAAQEPLKEALKRERVPAVKSELQMALRLSGGQ